MKIKNWISGVFLLTTAIVLVIMLAIMLKIFHKKAQVPDIEGIEPGEYFSDYPVGYIKIDEKGRTKYYPDMISTQTYEGVCSVDNNILTMKSSDNYWKFKIINEQLQLIEEKTYGNVNDCSEKERIFTLTKEDPGFMKGISYCADTRMRLYFGQDEVSLFVYEERVCLDRNYTFEDNVLKFGNDGDKITMLYEDNKFYLQDGWIDGRFYEFSADDIEFVALYDWTEDSNSAEELKNVILKMEYVSLIGDLKRGYYYNSDLSAELVIREDGEAEFCPDIKENRNVWGNYEYKDGQMILRRIWEKRDINITYFVTEDYVFDISDDKFIFTEHTDMYGNTTKYDENESNTFYYSEKSLINRIKPGFYYFSLDEEEIKYSFRLCFDNVGTVSVRIYDMGLFMGTYECNNGNLRVKLENGKEFTAILESDSIFVSDITCLDDNCPVQGEIECKYIGPSELIELFYQRR